MNVHAELQKMKETALNGELVDAILAQYKQLLLREGVDTTEQDYHRGKQALEPVLSEKQKKLLAQMEDLYREAALEELPLGFARGMYAAFRHHFSGPSPFAFSRLVDDQICTMPDMMSFVGYYGKKKRADLFCRSLEQQLDKANNRHLTSISCAWENRNYSVLVHSFYMGFRCATAMILDVDHYASYGQVTQSLLQIEHELGFTETLEERERSQRLRAKKLRATVRAARPAPKETD